ncbi:MULTISPECIES: metal-dependent transcriptional regulator [Breznakia]|uniref:DtxR family iron (Metal) dependent repressor n=1 Tax=Breznakia blatticola TaxID=1754012 RepID=A0A4R7ZPS0_9FIRM|nr:MULTISPECIES: metal-dependent transcriptional regulator [Breznakia]MDH6367024.1 DtxR family Mn-dependent transcriptional regulator [Breznakia sp. PH1-1]MDH6404204.1 DtxR family Mn-dependent transcriptional regulator [Breznakia sp. PF1-11]MDH6411911.1 DtxR family Mn-dependent transcriptional regulator [Breznakia sp. PFB1-11]MDH6414192.1 DtxR family Mn-dependent transcriptional regulator [Breznakia sp. PFB1-14]MDH6415985.1 DtxR family Mn-dependent transcriptional regulator [Breznakia sp. PFB1
MLLGESLEDYLETIMVLSEQSDKVRSIDVAKMMGVSKPSVNKAVNNLKDRGLITQEVYGGITLTKSGKEMGAMIFHRHTTIRSFLIEVLKVSEEIAEKDACRIEHIISNETFESIERMINEYKK